MTIQMDLAWYSGRQRALLEVLRIIGKHNPAGRPTRTSSRALCTNIHQIISSRAMCVVTFQHSGPVAINMGWSASDRHRQAWLNHASQRARLIVRSTLTLLHHGQTSLQIVGILVVCILVCCTCSVECWMFTAL